MQSVVEKFHFGDASSCIVPGQNCLDSHNSGTEDLNLHFASTIQSDRR